MEERELVKRQILAIRDRHAREYLKWHMIWEGLICQFCMDDLPDHKEGCKLYGKN